MQWYEYFSDAQFLWTATVAAVCSLSCSLLGCYLVLKRMSLLGDAVNHGMLPGIVVAVLLTGQISSFYLFLGAMAFGLLTAFLAQTLHAVGGVSEDASLGVVFTAFFALGVVLISRYVKHGDLDLDCVFMGNLDQLWERVDEVLPVQLLALAVALAFVALFWKEMKIAIFNPELATAMGFSAILLHYVLVALVAGVAVTSFEAVGSILVLPMLVVPAATAQLLTDRLDRMFLIAGCVAVVSALVGCLIAAYLENVNSAGMLAVVSGCIFGGTVILAPRHGLLAKFVRGWHLTLRIAGEDILSALYRAQESDTPPRTLRQPEHGFSPLTVRAALWRLERKGLIEAAAPGDWRLTEPGKEQAGDVVRAHRLWETFLEENFALPLDHLHGPASWMEHFLGPQVQQQLAAQLHQPHVDPHGKTIPPAQSSC